MLGDKKADPNGRSENNSRADEDQFLSLSCAFKSQSLVEKSEK